MVRDRITDGKRIAELLASELSGRTDGVLADVTVGDADPDAAPSADGNPAYEVRYEGTPVATVLLYPDRAAVRFESPAPLDATDPADRLDRSDGTLQIPSGAAVKDALDAIRAAIADGEW